MKRILSLFLSIITIAAVLSSCSSESADAETSAEVSLTTAATEAVITAVSETDAIETTKFTEPDFFDDAIFVGDSVTLGLKNRAVSQRNKGKDFLGNAQFLCAGSLNFYSAVAPITDQDAIHPTYKGEKVTVPDGIMRSGAKKVFIMLGMNDFSYFDESLNRQNVVLLLDLISDISPDIEIFVQSVTPIAAGYERGKFCNAKISEFNEYLQSVCIERGIQYLDINSLLTDENGYLRNENCGDLAGMGMHMSEKGAEIWKDYIEYTFDKENYDD